MVRGRAAKRKKTCPPSSGLPFAKFSAPNAVRLKIWTAAPAPPRLFLPQAAPRLRSLWPSGATDGPSGPTALQAKAWTFIYDLTPRVAVPCFCCGPQKRPCKKQTAAPAPPRCICRRQRSAAQPAAHSMCPPVAARHPPSGEQAAKLFCAQAGPRQIRRS